MKEKNKNELNDPVQPDKKKWRLISFQSFEEESEFTAKERAALSYDERMMYAEQLRRRVFSQYLQPDGRWMPLVKKITVKKQGS